MRLAVLAAAMFIAAPALAQSAGPWMVARTGDGAIGWRPASMVRNNGTDTAGIEAFFAFDTPKAAGDVSYSVLVQDVEFLCGDGRYKAGAGIYYTADLEPNGDGHGRDWQELPMAGRMAQLKAIACDAGKLPGQASAPDLKAALGIK
jgi:hypothetical protein